MTPNLLDGVQQNLEPDGNCSKRHPIRVWGRSRRRGMFGCSWRCERGYAADVCQVVHADVCKEKFMQSHRRKHFQEVTVNPVMIPMQRRKTQARWLRYGQITSGLLQNGCTSDVFPLRNSPGECQSAALSSENGLEWLQISVAPLSLGSFQGRMRNGNCFPVGV